jgi:glucosamine--fructose-6-phosphate aminotransferase (isomerizing)
VCGVFGYIGNLERGDWMVAHQLLRELAIAHERRGTDASGYAALTTRGQLLWERQAGPARELFEGRGFQCLRRRRIAMVIGHTRLATTGSPACNGNNHPHLAGSPTAHWALVHNGFIPGHRDKAAGLGLPLHSQCDSELLVQALHRYGEAAGPDICLSFGGKQSVLAIHRRTRHLLAWTNGEMPLVAFRVKGWSALWWASTEALAREALEGVGLRARFAVAKPDHVYRMEVRDGQVVMKTVRADAPRGRG